MGAVFERLIRDGEELHVSTGKVPYAAGEEHTPQWSAWENEGHLQMRLCLFPDCDREDFKDYDD